MSKWLFLMGMAFLLALSRALDSSDFCVFQWSKNKYQTCAMVNSSIEIFVEQDKGNDTFHFNCSSQPIENSISNDCNTDASGLFDVEVDMSGPRVRTEYEENVNITYDFKADTKDQSWWLSNVTISLYANLSRTANKTERVLLVGWVDGKKLINNVYLDYQRSYNCKANMTFLMNCSGCKDYHAKVYISFVNFQVQAFSFYNQTEFGNAYQCDADTTGSMIVPIAVGAALAVLVGIVFIAYIAGRLRSRRQSSYETLK